MKKNLLRLASLASALSPCIAGAIGFGDIVLLSRVGEPLRAEIPLVGATGEDLKTACFSLGPLPRSDLPVVTAARTQLVQRGPNMHLQISGSKPINEPVFIINLKAACGVNLERDYVLMPEAPSLSPARVDTVYSATSTPISKSSGNFSEWQTRAGETLESIAESQHPDDLVKQRRKLATLKRANPDLDAGTPLPEGTLVRIPEPKRIDSEYREPSPLASPPQPARRAPPSVNAPPTKAVATNASKSGDRLVLGSAEEAAKPKSGGSSPHASLSEMEQRIARMEASLSLLNQELEKMNNALLLTAQAMEAEQRLKLAESLATPPKTPDPSGTVQNAALPAAKQSNEHWQELLLSALLGGGIAIALAQYLGRRRQPAVESEFPLSLSAFRPKPKPAARQATQGPGTEAENTPNASANAPVTGEDRSILELAEVMLSYGRIQGSAETLASHIETTSPDNIRPWNMLLDWYRRGNMHEEFDVLAARMRKQFNTRVPAWDKTTAEASGHKSLEDYPHVIDHTILTWGTQDCMDYLQELAHDTRAGQRTGFPLEVIEEIALLLHLLEKGHGLTRPD